MKKLFTFLSLAAATIALVAEVRGNVTEGKVTSGGQTTSVDITHGVPAALPLTYFDAWNAIGGFQSREYSIFDGHIGFGDLRHSAVNRAYGMPIGVPAKYYRKQTGTSSWNVAASNTTWSGSFNFVMGKTAASGTKFLISAEWHEVHTENVQQANEFGAPLGIWYLTTTTLYATARANPPQGIPVFDGYWVAHYEEPDKADATEFTFSNNKMGLGSTIGPNYATRDSFFTSTPQGVWAAQPNPWTEAEANWHVDGYDYSIILSEEDTLADIQARIAKDHTFASLESIPWTKYRYIQNGELIYEANGSTDNLSLNNFSGDLTTTGNYGEERAQLRFVVPQPLRISGVGYRGRVIESFIPRTDPTHAQVVKIHEVDMREGQWESPVITPVMRPEDGRTVLKNFSAVAELIQPHPTLVLPPLGGVLSSTAPAEYQSTKPTIAWQTQATDSGGTGQISRQVLTGSATLQQINLSDDRGTLGTWSQAMAKWSILPGATAQVRLWLWTDDGTALGTWRLLTTDDDLRTYYGSSTKFVFAEATTAGQASIRITIKLNDQEIHDDLLVTAASLHASLAVDANRDGTIELPPDDPNAAYADATSTANPYRFWLNDDDDETVDASEPLLYTEIEQDDKDVLNESQQNWHRDTISCERDLEDFTRLWINTPGITAGLRNGDLKLALKWMISDGAPAIKLFRAAEADGGTNYLFNPGAATIQAQSFSNAGHYGVTISLTPLNGGEATTVIEDINGFVLPTSLFANITEQTPKICLLFEGCKAGRGQLKVVLLNKSGVEIGNGTGVWLQLMPASQMCHRWSCGDGDSTPPEDLRVDNKFAALSPLAGSLPDGERDIVLYVHGYNMKEYEKQRWIETTYKRLRILGYEGKVGGFTWPTAQQFKNFSNSEIIAWSSGDKLKELLADLKSRGYRVQLFAHSLGNVVAGEALRRWRAEGNTSKLVDTYIASQGAVSAACYNPSAPLMPDYDKVPLSGSTRSTMPPDVYARYWRAGDDPQRPELWPAINPSYLSDTFMTTAATRWVNFYNRNDYALTGFYETGNRLKPAQLANWLTGNLLSQYSYSPSMGYSEEHGTMSPFGFITLSIEPLKFPEDRYRIFTFAAPSWSLALGVIPTGGAFNSFTNLAGDAYGFGTEHRWHSGQFRSSNAERYQYWIALLDAARISHINP